MFAVLVYWLWAWFIWNSGLPRERSPRRRAAARAVGLRRDLVSARAGGALGTDLIGGVLLAVTALGVASTIAALLRRRAGRSA